MAIVSKTHVACSVVGGQIVDSWRWANIREGGSGIDCLVCDEISMIGLMLLIDINHLALRPKPLQFIICGDWARYLPLFNFFMGKEVTKSFEHCSLFHHFSGGNRLILRECRRSDKASFNDYTSILKQGSGFDWPLNQAVAYFRQKYIEDKAEGLVAGLAPSNLVLSHRFRINLNAKCNDAIARDKPDKVRFKLADYKIEEDVRSNSAQDAWYYSGQEVIAAVAKGVHSNAWTYVIQEILDKTVVLGDKDRRLELKRDEFLEIIRCLLALHNTDHEYFTREMLYVGMSRAIASNLLIVY